MKRNAYTCIIFAVSSLLIYVACSKTVQSGDKLKATNPTGRRDSTKLHKPQIIDSTLEAVILTVNSSTCPNAPQYGDSIVFLKPKNGSDFIVYPMNNANVDGTYLSWPKGLKLNKNTGAINLSQSETGVRYNLAFIKNGSTDTCVSQLIVGGLTYMDEIYNLDQSDTLAMPVFNADPYAHSVCDFSDDTDYPDNNGNGNNKCVFDDDSPGQRANDQKLRVRSKSGIINLKRSMEDGLFGKNPRNGESKIVQIKYKLNDASQNADQKISVQVMYYDNVSGIPNAIQNEIAGKRANMYNYKIVNGQPRPPLIIIAGLKK